MGLVDCEEIHILALDREEIDLYLLRCWAANKPGLQGKTYSDNPNKNEKLSIWLLQSFYAKYLEIEFLGDNTKEIFLQMQRQYKVI